MSDYNNPNPNEFDKYGNPIPGTTRPFFCDPAESNSRAPYALLGILALIGIVGGALYFNGSHRTARDVAAAPPAMTDTVTPRAAAPAAPMTGPVNTTPAPTATPAPAGPPSSTQQ